MKVCTMCGQPLAPSVHHLTKYCPDCREEMHRTQSRALAQKKAANKSTEKKPAVRYCKVCGKKLPAGSSANRMYCDHCRGKINLDAAKERGRRRAEALKAEREAANFPPPPHGKHKMVDKPCQICGKMLHGVDPGTWYCPDCRKALYKAPTAPKKAELKSSHENIVDDNAAAIAKGMTYGQYKQWQRRQKELMERGEKVEE